MCATGVACAPLGISCEAVHGGCRGIARVLIRVRTDFFRYGGASLALGAVVPNPTHKSLSVDDHSGGSDEDLEIHSWTK